VGRFLSRDPIQDGYNWYAYVGNDPVNGVDPKGLETIKLPGVGDSPGPGWREDKSHKDPKSKRWISPSGDDALDGTRGTPGENGWEGKDHWHRYKKDRKGEWEKDKKVGDRGHLNPGDEVDVEPLPAPPQSHMDPTPVIQIGIGIGAGYLIYRGIRLLPSLLPPLWPTLPVNLAVP
jgi:uncharacterized protein RhaS with RHS repeats